MKNFGYIYKITNLVNGKIYIGQTTKSLKQRFNGHCRDDKTYISNAIKKYGKHNFTIESVVRCNSAEELNIREQNIIRIYKSLSPNGYNIALGGYDRSRIRSPMQNKKHSEETKLKMSLAAKGKIKSLEARQRISAARRGYTWTIEHKYKFKKTRTGMTKKGREVISEQYNKSFKSVSEASKELNIPRRTINRWLKYNKNTNIIQYRR